MPSPPALHSTLGAILVGIIISLVLFGVMCVQAFTYYQSDYKNDRAYVKLLIIWCCVIETAHTGFLCTYLYETLVLHFGDYDTLLLIPWTLSFSLTVATFISAPVQIFFAHRVYVLSERKIFLIISTVECFTRLALSFVGAILGGHAGTIALFTEKYIGFSASAIALGAMIDVMNTVLLCYYLAKFKSVTTRSSKIVDALIVWTIETGLLTSICMTSSFVLLITMKNNSLWVCPLMFAPKLYSNSLLASLNGRISLRQVLWSTHLSNISPSDQEATPETHIRFEGVSTSHSISHMPSDSRLSSSTTSATMPDFISSFEKVQNEKPEVCE